MKLHFGRRSFSVGLVILAALALAGTAACSSTPSYRGTAVAPPLEATPFQLHDQFGERVSLADFAGKVVALTFLYTNCPDVCPLTTEALRQAYVALSNDASQVVFVAITVDSTRDTAQRAYEYSEQKGMLDKWRFLTGSLQELSPVWEGYFIAAEAYRLDTGGAAQQLSQAALAQEAQQEGIPPYLIAHQAPVYLIDHKGFIRVLHSDVTLDVRPLVEDIRTLLKD